MYLPSYKSEKQKIMACTRADEQKHDLCGVKTHYNHICNGLNICYNSRFGQKNVSLIHGVCDVGACFKSMMEQINARFASDDNYPSCISSIFNVPVM